MLFPSPGPLVLTTHLPTWPSRAVRCHIRLVESPPGFPAVGEAWGPFRSLHQLWGGGGSESINKGLRPVCPYKAGLEGLPLPPAGSPCDCSSPRPLGPSLGGYRSSSVFPSLSCPFQPSFGDTILGGSRREDILVVALIPLLAPGGPLPYSSKETPQILHGMYPCSQRIFEEGTNTGVQKGLPATFAVSGHYI